MCARRSFSVLSAIALCGLASTLLAQAAQEVENSLGMKLVLIPAGTFQMGSPQAEEGAHADEVQHEVTLTTPFYLGSTEVTQAQYLKVMGKNPSNFQAGSVRESDASNFPVEIVTWLYAMEFCRKLSDLPQEKAAGRVYRLPTEAEWEYACRAGSTGPYAAVEESDELHHFAWSKGNSDNVTHPVAGRKPNRWGLFDMHGNVWEWCRDHYQSRYDQAPVTNPTGPKTGTEHVVRGGSFLSRDNHCRSASRLGHLPDHAAIDCGFRVLLQSSGK
ncbi:MAG: formylglycine-generating enzyme family protein [Planctomycetota bacterium]